MSMHDPRLPRDISIVDDFISEQDAASAQQWAAARVPAGEAASIPLPRVLPENAQPDVEPLPRPAADAFIRVLLFYRYGGGQAGDYPLGTALSMLEGDNANDRIGRFIYTLWPRLDPTSRQIIHRLPEVWDTINTRWRQMSQAERDAGTRFYKPIFNVYEELLSRPLP